VCLSSYQSKVQSRINEEVDDHEGRLEDLSIMAQEEYEEAQVTEIRGTEDERALLNKRNEAKDT
jgi:hypothetical protein